MKRHGLLFAAVILLFFAAHSPAGGQAKRSPGVVVVVSAHSPVTKITRLQLADLYLGRTTRLENAETAVPVDQQTGSRSRAVFSETFLGRSEAQMKAHWSKIIFTGRGRPPREFSNPEAAREFIRSNPGAIGYLEPSLVDSTLRVVQVH